MRQTDLEGDPNTDLLSDPSKDGTVEPQEPTEPSEPTEPTEPQAPETPTFAGQKDLNDLKAEIGRLKKGITDLTTGMQGISSTLAPKPEVPPQTASVLEQFVQDPDTFIGNIFADRLKGIEGKQTEYIQSFEEMGKEEMYKPLHQFVMNELRTNPPNLPPSQLMSGDAKQAAKIHYLTALNKVILAQLPQLKAGGPGGPPPTEPLSVAPPGKDTSTTPTTPEMNDQEITIGKGMGLKTKESWEGYARRINKKVPTTMTFEG